MSPHNLPRPISQTLRLVVVYWLVLALLAGCVPPAAPVTQLPAASGRIQPALTDLIAEQPDAVVDVIIQKSGPAPEVAAAISQLGGLVTRDLYIINALAARMPGYAVASLAQTPGVRLINLDARVINTGADLVYYVLDTFDQSTFTNNDGTNAWKGAWIEYDPEAGGEGPGAGQVQILNGQLRLDDSPNTNQEPNILRQVDLSNATAAVASFDYQTTAGVDADDAAVVEISADGGASYTILETFTGITGVSFGSRKYDLTPFISDNTIIRFRITNLYGAGDEFFVIDNVQITHSGAAVTPPPAVTPIELTHTVLDTFEPSTFVNDHGTESWTGAWVEHDPIGGGEGPGAGQVQIFEGQLQLDDYPNTGQDPNILRRVDLSMATTAKASFDYRTTAGVDDTDAAVIEISADGGTTYTILETFTGITGVSFGRREYDITPFISNSTTLRFRIANLYGTSDEFFLIDNVNIAHDGPAGTPLSPLNPVQTTWASFIGPKEKNEFNGVANMVDEAALGPDGVYGSGADVKGSFAGFEIAETPGHAISKVDLLLPAFAQSSFDKEIKFKVYLQNDRKSEFKLRSTIFNKVVGAGNAGVVAVDITDSHPWQLIDFHHNLEIVIEHNGFKENEGHVVFYDAIGLRVTMEPGIDNSLDQLAESQPLPKEAIDVTNLTNVYNQVVRVPEVWNEWPNYVQGNGVGVAIVDSGVGKNKDLSRRGKDINFSSSNSDSKDRYGHGTFVASVVASNGKHSNGAYMGIAPSSKIYNVRVSDDEGMSYESDVVEALQWIWENQEKEPIRVVNLSLNSAVAQSYHDSPLAAAVEVLWFNGIVVVVSAGNNGTANLYPPANDPWVITVGATDDKGTISLGDDEVAAFSAYGISEAGHVKPELVAPGRNLVAYVPSNDKLTIGKNHSSHSLSTDFFRMSGTSMSAPMVTGAVALLLQDEPNLTPDQVKMRLMATANRNWPGYDPMRAGAGLLDIYAAVHGTTTEAANSDAIPHMLLARMAMIALWASNNGDGTGNWENVDWNSVNWNSVNWNSVNWNSVNWNSVNWNSVNWNSVNWNSVNWNSVNWNSVNWNSVNWNSVSWNSDYWDNSMASTRAAQAKMPELEKSGPYRIYLPSVMTRWDSVNWNNVNGSTDFVEE